MTASLEPPRPRDEGELTVWVRLIRRRWRTGAAVFVPVFVLGVLALVAGRPVYRAEARLRLGEPPPASGVSPTGFLGLFRLGGDPFANDFELFSSRTVAERTVIDGALNARVSAPRHWHRDSLFTVFTATASTVRAAFEAEWIAADRVRVTRTSPDDSLIGETSAGETIAFGGLAVAFRPRDPDGPERIQISTMLLGDAVRRTQPRIRLERPRREANVLEVTFQDADPGLARTALSAAVNRFVELRTEIQKRESGSNVDSLRSVASRTREELRRAESAMSSYQEGSGLVVPGEQAAAFVDRYGDVLSRLELARAERAAMATLLTRVESIDDRMRAWTELVSHPRFLENQTVGAVLEQLVELEQRRLELARRRSETSRELTVLEEQITSLDRTLRTLALGFRDGLTQQMGELERQVAQMDSVLKSLPVQSVELARRQREVRVLSEVLVLTEQRLRQEALREALTFANVQVFDPPALRFKPVSPRKRLGVMISFLLAALFATAGMVARDRLDRSVRTANDVQQAIAAPLLTIAVRPRGEALRIAAEDADAALRHILGDAAARGGRVAIVPIAEGGAAGEVAAALNGAVRPGRRIENFAGAVAASADGAPVVFTVEWGRTPLPDLERAAALVRQARGRVAGAIMVVPSARHATLVWD